MNILFLMADEFRFDAAGFGGNTVARTPHLDRLASRAVVFDNAYTPSPVCVPGRQCLAMGRYARHIGCETFGEDIAPGSPTFARWFAEHGYYTVCCGKLHHRGPDQMQGWLHRIGSETAVRWPERFHERSQVGRRKWRGAADVRDAGAGESPLGIHDDYTARGACDFIRMHFGGMTATSPEVPLLLMVSLQQPHFPLLGEKDLVDHYLPRVPVYWNQPRAGHPALDKGRIDESDGVTEDDIRRATAAYYAMVEQTDRRIGEVLGTLERMGQDLSAWTVVFTADHGEMLGEHGVWEKRKFYEGSARVPLFIGAPDLEPRRSASLANLVDLFPTLAQLAGLPAPENGDGSDLFGTARPEQTFSQYERDQFMLRRGSWKYLRFAEMPEVLFDLATDPGERRNRIGDPAAAEVAAGMRTALDEFLAGACAINPVA